MKPKILVVVANYYEKVSLKLSFFTKGILDKKTQNKFISVPGVFEIPVVISRNINKYDAFIALGCVIKGETPHFDYISKTTIDALMKLSIENKKPIGNGIITCFNKKQALERSNPRKKNKGGEAARAVLSVLGILKNESK